MRGAGAPRTGTHSQCEAKYERKKKTDPALGGESGGVGKRIFLGIGQVVQPDLEDVPPAGQQRAFA